MLSNNNNTVVFNYFNILLTFVDSIAVVVVFISFFCEYWSRCVSGNFVTD